MFSVFLLAYAFFFFPTHAAPADGNNNRPIVVPHLNPSKIICRSPVARKYLCPAQGTSLNRPTPLGIAQGVADPEGALRFAVKYGIADRWQPSSVVTAWNLPDGSTNVSSLPLACPQPNLDPSLYTEDCLSMVLYVPPSLNLQSAVPTLVWIHGGSFIVGSASAAGLDGSKLAIATNSIVAVIQHRLGALGFMPPNGQTNLAVKDVITALNFVRRIVPSFGGCTSKVTLAGQSSGATMIRALLAAPSVSSLFRSAILQSDPMNFGFLKPRTQTTLQNYFTSQIGCTSTDYACLNGLNLATIIDAQMSTFGAAPTLDPAAGTNVPIRPVLDGSLITFPLDLSGPFPAQNKPLLITSVAQEAGFAIYTFFTQPLPQAILRDISVATFGTNRTDIILANPLYAPTVAPDGTSDIRPLLQTIGTDSLWRCSSWSFARSWVQSGGTAYVGEYIVGASYPGNEVALYCTQPGIVCHQDDIEIIFGTAVNQTNPQSTLIGEMQSRYKSFLQNGNPNAGNLPTWAPALNDNVHPILLGGSGEAAVGACDPGFWGKKVEYDCQFYNH